MFHNIFFTILLILLIIIGCTKDSQKTVNLTVEIEKLLDANKAWFEAEKNRDLDNIMPYVAKNAVFQPQDAPSFSGYETIKSFYLDLFKLNYTDIGGKSDTIIVSSSGDIAYDIGENYIIFDTPDGKIKSEGKYLAIWRKIEDNWKVVAISWSGNAPPK